MAWYKTGGGSQELQETVLWTNTNHTSTDYSKTITCSDGYDSYDFIKIYYVPYTTAKDVSELGTMWLYIDTYFCNNPDYWWMIGAYSSQGTATVYKRRFHFTSSTALFYYNGTQHDSNGGYVNYCVPTKITGIKL